MNKRDVYRGKDCMKKFCESAMKIIYIKKKEMKLLTNVQQESYEMQKPVLFVRKKLKINVLKMKNIVKLGIIVNILNNIDVLCITYVI